MPFRGSSTAVPWSGDGNGTSAGPSRHLRPGSGATVKLVSGALSAVTEQALLNGANVLAIGDGSTDRWEIIQFRDAVLVGPQTYDLRLRLRGQAGTDRVAPADGRRKQGCPYDRSGDAASSQPGNAGCGAPLSHRGRGSRV